MHLDFIREAMGVEYPVVIEAYDGYERAVISAGGFEDSIEINYFPDGYNKYILNFASWNMETSSKDALLDAVLAFAERELAAIEFFEDGVACFGGAIDMDIAEDISYGELRGMFDDEEDITKLTFSVRSWDRFCCYDGLFAEHATDGYTVIRIYKGTAV